ncbi:MarR family winged helix-turn-helix transcriptional regulator [Streptomyces sp. NPDC006733]|uniref:MarR family winged helix-turn-helix transcriptional regulator n=1 Tax=Streptomyces sp. NPDC006733 TaxID=3155460 RepID=UPI0033F5C1C0
MPTADPADAPPLAPQLPPDLAAQELSGSPADPSDLDRRLASALERAGHALRTLIWTQATAHGLSPIQVQLLLRLGVEPPERRRVGTLAAEFDLSAATVSEALATLRRKGLVDRQPVPGDKRGHVMAPTEAGLTAAAALSRWPDPVTTHLAALSTEDKGQTLRLILDLVGHLADTGVLSVARTCTTCRFFHQDEHEDRRRPHHCALLDTAIGDPELRVDCAEHQPARET